MMHLEFPLSRAERTWPRGRPISVFDGGLNRSTQHFILKRKDGVYNGSKISSRFHRGGEDGIMRPLAAWGVFEGDRSSVWEAVIVCLFPGGPVRGYPSCSKASLEAGISAFGAGGDFQRHYGASISPIDSQSAGSLAFNGEPGD